VGGHALKYPITWLCLTAGASAAGVEVDLQGLEEEQRDAVLASLQLDDLKKPDVSPAQLRAAYAKADEQVRQALEPFGYYDTRVEKSLTGDAAAGWKAKITVKPGEPVIVRSSRVEVAGEGKDQRRVVAAVQDFAPREGSRLDHATYEASKAVLETSLRGAGFLDAQSTQRRVTVNADDHSAEVDLRYESGPRYKFGDVRFAGDAPFPEGFLQDFVPWRDDAFFNSEQVLNLQQRLVDADYFSLVSVQPALDEKKDGAVPIDVLLNRDERTVYTGEVYYSTDFGAGVRLGAERRWLNKKGHKAKVLGEYSQRLQEASVRYQIPRPSREDRSYDFGVAYRDETTDVSRSRNFQLAATRLEKRWHGFTRTIGLKYLDGDFELGNDEDNPEFGSSRLLWAEGTLRRRRLNDRLAPRKGYLLDIGLRVAAEAVVSDTDIAQAWVRNTWLVPVGEKSGFKFRGEIGGMVVDDFDALPPDLRFYAGGDRSIRGYDYHEIGEKNENGTVIGGEYLGVVNAEYEWFFKEDWGAAVFVDAGDAFTHTFSVNVGAGFGVRWRSPLGPIRIDIGFPVHTDHDIQNNWRVHLQLGPDI
jgi:translocation and assembly module TamA